MEQKLQEEEELANQGGSEIQSIKDSGAGVCLIGFIIREEAIGDGPGKVRDSLGEEKKP